MDFNRARVVLSQLKLWVEPKNRSRFVIPTYWIKSLCGNLEIYLNHCINAYFRWRNSLRVLFVAARYRKWKMLFGRALEQFFRLKNEHAMYIVRNPFSCFNPLKVCSRKLIIFIVFYSDQAKLTYCDTALRETLRKILVSSCTNYQTVLYSRNFVIQLYTCTYIVSCPTGCQLACKTEGNIEIWSG